MKICDIIYENEYESSNTLPEDLEVSNITRKAEEIVSGTIFFLLKSIKKECENILNTIKDRNDIVVVSQKEFLDEPINTCVLYVTNARLAIAYAYSRFYGINYEKTKFVAVTGTNGKTTTATLIKSILLNEGEKVGFIGTGKIEINGKTVSEKFYSMTTPDPEVLYAKIAEMQKENCKYIIMEASSHALYYHKLAPIPFEIGIFTNLSPEHLDFHKNIEDYYETKLKLFSQCKTGIFNCDDNFSRKALRNVKCKTSSVGILWPSEAMAREINQKGLSGIEYIYREESLIFKVKTQLIGAYNIYNTLLAIKALIILNFKPCRIKEALKDIKFIPGRFEIIRGKVTVVKDYAHTSFAFENLLKTVKSLKNPKQNIIIVFGCGGERDKSKRPEMAKTAEKYSNLSIITNDNPRGEDENEIISDILSGYENSEKRIVITDRKKAIQHAIMRADANDIVIIAGKGCEDYIIDKQGYRYFSEDCVIKEALSKRAQEEEERENSFRNSPSVYGFE